MSAPTKKHWTLIRHVFRPSKGQTYQKTAFPAVKSPEELFSIVRKIGKVLFKQINEHKAQYYKALQKSSEGWTQNENSYFPFIENFLSILYMCFKEIDKRFAVISGKKISKKARIEATVLNSLTPLSKADIFAILPDVSPTTVEAVL